MARIDFAIKTLIKLYSRKEAGVEEEKMNDSVIANL